MQRQIKVKQGADEVSPKSPDNQWLRQRRKHTSKQAAQNTTSETRGRLIHLELIYTPWGQALPLGGTGQERGTVYDTVESQEVSLEMRGK